MSTIKPILDSIARQSAIANSAAASLYVAETALAQQATRDLAAAAEVWRNSLAHMPEPAITDAVARAIAETAGIAAHMAAPAAGMQVAEIAESYQPMFEVAERFAAVQRAALASAFIWTERMRQAAEQDKKYDEALLKLGWFVPPSMPLSTFRRAGAAAIEGDDTGVCQVMAGLARPDLLWLVESWMDEPAFAARREIILDAVGDHGDGRFRVSVRTLLPELEGIAFDVFAPGGYEKPQKMVERAVRAYDPVEGEAIVAAMFLLYDTVEFSTLPPDSTKLNRHAVLHGRTLAFGTEKNSLNLFFALDLLHVLVSAKNAVAAA